MLKSQLCYVNPTENLAVMYRERIIGLTGTDVSILVEAEHDTLGGEEIFVGVTDNRYHKPGLCGPSISCSSLGWINVSDLWNMEKLSRDGFITITFTGK